MYKLVVVGGKFRGKEFVLQNGENILGSDASCSIHMPLEGISKKHLSVTVTPDSAFVEDLKSSNGTFVNGKLIKKRTMQADDKIALPNAIIQLVYVKEKVITVKKQVIAAPQAQEESDETTFDSTVPFAGTPIGKFILFFKSKLMKPIYGFNEEHEWRFMISVLLSIFVLATIAFTIFPILQDNRKILLSETARRADTYVEMIARLNHKALEQGNLDRLDTNFLDSEDGIESYELIDLNGRIVRPASKLNQYTQEPFTIEAKELALNKNTNLKIYKKSLNHGEIGVAKTIFAYNMQAGSQEPVGVIAIRFAPKSLAIEAASNSKAYLESFIKTAIVALFFFGIVYFLTLRPIEEMRLQIDQVLRGKKKELESNYLMDEMKPLRESVNALLHKIKELQRADGDMTSDDIEDDSIYVQKLEEFMMGATGPVMILNSEKQIKRLNTECEDLLGVRENSSVGMAIDEVVREQGIAATMIGLCDRSANNEGTSQKDEYELQGKEYNIFVTALMGKDKFAKAYYITFIKEQ